MYFATLEMKPVPIWVWGKEWCRWCRKCEWCRKWMMLMKVKIFTMAKWLAPLTALHQLFNFPLVLMCRSGGYYLLDLWWVFIVQHQVSHVCTGHRLLSRSQYRLEDRVVGSSPVPGRVGKMCSAAELISANLTGRPNWLLITWFLPRGREFVVTWPAAGAS